MVADNPKVVEHALPGFVPAFAAIEGSTCTVPPLAINWLKVTQTLPPPLQAA